MRSLPLRDETLRLAIPPLPLKRPAHIKSYTSTCIFATTTATTTVTTGDHVKLVITYQDPCRRHIEYSLPPIQVSQARQPDVDNARYIPFEGGSFPGDKTYMHVVESLVDVFEILVMGHKLVYPEFATEVIYRGISTQFVPHRLNIELRVIWVCDICSNQDG